MAMDSALDFSIYAAPKIDCHCHVLDPAGFAYAPGVTYRPAGQETGSADYFGAARAGSRASRSFPMMPATSSCGS